MQVIGICRFSYPAVGGFQVEHDSIQDRMAYLYAPQRMQARFALFEAFTLPCLRAQTDPDFTFVIVTGDSLPKPYLDRLQHLIADIPQIQLQQHASGPHRAVMKTAIDAVRIATKEPCLQFRLDDDDAFAVSFVETLRAKAALARPLLREVRTLALDFNQGHIARPTADGIEAAPVTAAYWSPALAIMISSRADTSVMNFSHHKLWQRMPTVTFPGTDMMLRGMNDYNDSRQKPAAKPARMQLLTPQQEDYFRQTYNIDADAIRASASRPQ